MTREPGRPNLVEISPGRLDPAGIRSTFSHRLLYSVAENRWTATPHDCYQALALSVRDRVMERWFATRETYYARDPKRAYYLSLEFLMGRFLGNAVANLGARDATALAIQEIGYRLEDLEDQEPDAGLGNGGLGRLAACYLDSAATLAVPLDGYGIRYDFGIFRQRIEGGEQVEDADTWLRFGSPWDIERPSSLCVVQFYGQVEPWTDEEGHSRLRWSGTEDVVAIGHDFAVVGHGNGTVNTLRLWSARSVRELDLARFNRSEYVEAVEEKVRIESISKVLYPTDEATAGKELRLRQQYFFVAATLHDILRRFRKRHADLRRLPDKVAIQLNDTHPAIAIAELMRILLDQELFSWDEAWTVTTGVFAYTNHTVLPEALETWPASMLGKLLPRHLQIVEEIDRRLRSAAAEKWPDDAERVERVAVVSSGETPTIRMANLAFAGSSSVNGVAELHTRILRKSLFADLDALLPGRLRNVTNGITPRRWVLQANQPMTRLVTDAIGSGWLHDFEEVGKIGPFAEDAAFRERWRAAKLEGKVRFAEWLRQASGVEIDVGTLFDVQVKRIHEYKRQLLNAMHVVSLLHRLRDGGEIGAPRTVVFGGKAAPSYARAKRVIRLIHAVGDLVAAEPRAKGRLAVVFVPNYGVSVAERIFPACDLSEQISTAGTEASGTGNMKAAANGALTIGTMDGANVEIVEAVGAENAFIFGHGAEEIEELRRNGDDPAARIAADPRLARVVEEIESGAGTGDRELFADLARMLRSADRYFHCADFASYLEAQERASAAWHDTEGWSRMSIRNVAGVGKFSSDRALREYADRIWGVERVPVRLPAGH